MLLNSSASKIFCALLKDLADVVNEWPEWVCLGLPSGMLASVKGDTRRF